MTDGTSAHRAPSPREVVERVHRMAMDYDLTGQADLYAADGVLEWPFAPAGVPRRTEGREEIRRVLEALGHRVRGAGTRLTGLNSVVIHETLDPEVVIVELEAHAEVPATGMTYQLPYIQVLRIRDGQIASFRDYFGSGTAAVLEAAFGSTSTPAERHPA
jgi:ketosteroid isomerase-like protein